jgi:hypothetical protein
VRISGRTIPGLTTALIGALLLAAAAPAAAASRSKTRFDGIRDCERTASVQLRRHNPAFRRFMIDRATVAGDRYADRIGPMFVSTVYHGRATYEAAAGPRTTRFICLHGGMHRRALFVYTLPD